MLCIKIRLINGCSSHLQLNYDALPSLLFQLPEPKKEGATTHDFDTSDYNVFLVMVSGYYSHGDNQGNIVYKNDRVYVYNFEWGYGFQNIRYREITITDAGLTIHTSGKNTANNYITDEDANITYVYGIA